MEDTELSNGKIINKTEKSKNTAGRILRLRLPWEKFFFRFLRDNIIDLKYSKKSGQSSQAQEPCPLIVLQSLVRFASASEEPRTFFVQLFQKFTGT